MSDHTDLLLLVQQYSARLKIHLRSWFMPKGSSGPSHLIFKINVGKSRIRHTTTLKLNDKFLDWLKIDWKFKFRVVICRIQLFPTLISKMKCVWSPDSGLPLTQENSNRIGLSVLDLTLQKFKPFRGYINPSFINVDECQEMISGTKCFFRDF